MNLTNVRAGLYERALRTGLRGYDSSRSSLDPDCFVVALGAGEYHNDFTDGETVTWTVLCLFTRAGGDERAQYKIDDLLSPDTATSMIDALETAVTGDVLTTACDTVQVIGWGEPGTYTAGDTEFVGVEVTVATIT